MSINWSLFVLFGLLSLTAAHSVRAADCISVRDCGAIGDGVHDDTDAFLKAVELARREQKNVYVPIGTYATSKTIVLDKVAMNGPQVSAWVGDESVHMPSIVPTHRDGPAFQMLDSSALDGIDI
ncbi:MAG TPA: glycosyl hydrolase family 28-related protein, partial [bacterium]|nr:glycosyl hydrolase family 28-related protein [bacterium]